MLTSFFELSGLKEKGSYNYNDRVNGYELYRACSTHGKRRSMHTGF
jgi:hypothetical protein